jgi:glycosyltransferase involved in cell wall biosynthesis
MVSSLWPPHVMGGAEIYAGRLAEHLRDRGHEVDVLTHGVTGRHHEAVKAWPYRVDQFAGQPPWNHVAFRAVDIYNPQARRALHRLVTEPPADIVHSHSIAGLSTSVLAEAATSSAAHLHTLHDYWLLCRRTTLVRGSGAACTSVCGSCRAIGGIRQLLLRRHRPDMVIAPSHAIAVRHQHLPWAAGRLVELPHPVERQERTRMRPMVASGQSVTFGFAGQLTAAKGVPTLLRAFEPLAGEGHTLVVAGRARDHDGVSVVGRGVVPLGWLQGAELDAFYDSIDCLVVPSEWPENAPMVVNEARGRQIPVIASRIGGLPELIDSASQPLLFEAGDVDGLRNAMRRFADDPEIYVNTDPLGSTWDEHVTAMIELYQRAIAERGSSL